MFPVKCYSVTESQSHSVKCHSVSKTWRWLTFPHSPAGGEDSDGHQHGAALLPPTVGRHHREDVAPGVSAISRDQWWAVIWWDGMGLGRILSLARMYWKYHNLNRYNLDLGFSVLHQSKSVVKYSRFNILFSSEVKWSISLSSLLTSPTVVECC